MLTVNLQTFKNSTPAQQQFALSAMGHLERMVNNPFFLGRLHAIQFAPTLFAPDNSRQATNQDVVQVISGGIEWLMVPQGTSSTDYQLDIWTSLVDISDTTVVGG